MRKRFGVRAVLTIGAAAAALSVVSAAEATGQTGTVTGTVRNEQTRVPISGVQITVQGTGIGTISRDNGQYLLLNVPAGTHTLEARLIGFATATVEVTVAADETARMDFSLVSQPVAMGELVVTGTVRATPRAKLPFTVDQVRGEDMQVPQLDPIRAIQAKVPGVMIVEGSGRPGSSASVLLRGPTAIGSSGRNQDPLFIVDGVILGSSIVDIDAADIESVEIVKGAAAASLYGSRAAAGVISITTNRGRQMSDGTVRYTVRSSYGQSDLRGRFPLLESTFWDVTADGTRFIDGDGQPCDFRGSPGWNPAQECSANPRLGGQRAGDGARNQWNTFATNEWPRGTFDHVKRFFNGDDTYDQYISVTGRQGATNFLVSFNRTDVGGVMIGQSGLRRNNFRVNVDQMVRPELQVAATAFYSRSIQDDFGESQGNPIFGLTRMQAGVDLASCEPDLAPGRSNCLRDPRNLLLNVNPTNLESANPLYEVMVGDNELTRGRVLASTNVRWSPLHWFDIDGDVSYDRLSQERFASLPKGYRTIGPSASQNEGNLQLTDWRQEALNASATASFRIDIGDRIVNRTQLRYAYEQEENVVNSTTGNTFAVAEVPRFNNIDSGTLGATSSFVTIRSEGFYFITNFDIYDRYILDGMIRNDGSSLFGADERRKTYGRLAGAWRIAQEPWFYVPAVDELRLFASWGTAGGRPTFSAQYETFSVAQGRITPLALGNRNLKPEHSTEIETGFEASLWGGRLTGGVTYATTTTKDQILDVPLPAFMGFSRQVRNVGTLESNTWEASLGVQLVNRPNFNWSTRLLYDRTDATITELHVPDFRFGVDGQRMGEIFYAREGEKYGTFYGPKVARSCADLPPGMSCDGFVVDQNGLLVWVGAGGLAANAWGTTSPHGMPWGTPFQGWCADRVSGEPTQECPVGNSMPDFTVRLANTIEWRGLSLYGLLDAVRGFDVYNQPLQWGLFRRNIGLMDQRGVPEAEQKPIGYWDALYGGLGGLVPNDYFVEDGSFVKLRELSLRYRLNADQLGRLPVVSGFHGMALSLSGRNLHTWSNYRGYDPETGRAGGDVGSAAIARVDGYNYPNFRTWTVGIELTY